MKERLHRLERLHIDYPIYFVTACTDGRKPLLADPEVHATFRAFSCEALKRNIFVGRYVFMPDHIHLFVTLPPSIILKDQHPLSSWIKALKGTISKALREKHIPAPHWQKGFFDHVLRSSESYSEKWQYVVENPVRAGLSKNWEEWAFQGEIYPLEARH
jgi:putative transposase